MVEKLKKIMLKTLGLCLFFMENGKLSGKQVAFFSSTIRRIWRAITVAPASPLHMLKFSVHPRNKLISMHILLV